MSAQQQTTFAHTPAYCGDVDEDYPRPRRAHWCMECRGVTSNGSPCYDGQDESDETEELS